MAFQDEAFVSAGRHLSRSRWEFQRPHSSLVTWCRIPTLVKVWSSTGRRFSVCRCFWSLGSRECLATRASG